MADLFRLEVRLDPNGVLAPTARVLATASHVVSSSIAALSAAPLADAGCSIAGFGLSFPDPFSSREERLLAYQSWLLAKGFQDLVRGVRETLEEAAFYCDMVDYLPVRVSPKEFDRYVAKVKRNNGYLNNPKLLQKIQARLVSPLSFSAEMNTLIKIRNCLEHRGGRVGREDVDDSSDKLSVSYPRPKIFYMKGAEEVEIRVGEIIDTHDPNGKLPKGSTVQVYFTHAVRQKEYNLGDQIVITPEEFSDIVFACYFFAADLVGKLPAAILADR